MLDILLLILLIFGFLIGLKRGLVMQVLHIVGFIVAFIVSVLYYKQLAGKLELWIPYPDFSTDQFWGTLLNSTILENSFYNAIAFFAIFVLVKIIMQIIANLLDFVANLPILHSVNNLLGAILGFLEMYLILFVILFILSLVSVEMIQNLIQSSAIAGFMIEHTPVLTEQLKERIFPE